MSILKQVYSTALVSIIHVFHSQLNPKKLLSIELEGILKEVT